MWLSGKNNIKHGGSGKTMTFKINKSKTEHEGPKMPQVVKRASGICIPACMQIQLCHCR